MVPSNSFSSISSRILFPRKQIQESMKLPHQIILLLSLLLIGVSRGFAQEENTAIRNGNKFYKQKQYDKALPEYQKAMQLNPKNAVPVFNAGNVQYRKDNYE